MKRFKYTLIRTIALIFEEFISENHERTIGRDEVIELAAGHAQLGPAGRHIYTRDHPRFDQGDFTGQHVNMYYRLSRSSGSISAADLAQCVGGTI